MPIPIPIPIYAHRIAIPRQRVLLISTPRKFFITNVSLTTATTLISATYYNMAGRVAVLCIRIALPYYVPLSQSSIPKVYLVLRSTFHHVKKTHLSVILCHNFRAGEDLWKMSRTHFIFDISIRFKYMLLLNTDKSPVHNPFFHATLLF